MLRIGITGGIGSGKTTVANVLKTFNIPVFDADAVAKKLMDDHASLRENITRHFGDVYHQEKLDRQKLATIVFADEQKLQLLNSLVHPATLQYWENWANAQTSAYIVKEAAILFESGSAAGLDFIIGVYAPEALRIQRVMHRNNITRKEVIVRMRRQVNESLKMKLCDFIVTNDDKHLLVPQVIAIHQKLLSIN